MKKQKALFLDRDGVINIDHGYVSKIEDFEFTKGIFELLHLFLEKDYLIFIITNQSGIGRGYYTLQDFKALTQWMIGILEEKGISIQSVQYCPHAPEENCKCRKPQTGMIDSISKEYAIDYSKSWLIGDKQSDIDLAINCEIPHSISISKIALTGNSYHYKSIAQCLSSIKENNKSQISIGS